MAVDERHSIDKRPRYDCLLFDYVVQKLGVDKNKVTKFCREMHKNYAISMAGLRLVFLPFLLYGFLQYLVVINLVVDVTNDFFLLLFSESLQAVGYEFDYDDYHSFVNGRLPYENLKPDPVLKSLLLSMPQRKIIFTNGDKVHAAKVLSRLGLEDCFEGVIYFEMLNSHPEAADNNNSWDTPIAFMPRTPVICKPSINAMERAIHVTNADP